MGREGGGGRGKGPSSPSLDLNTPPPENVKNAIILQDKTVQDLCSPYLKKMYAYMYNLYDTSNSGKFVKPFLTVVARKVFFRFCDTGLICAVQIPK